MVQWVREQTTGTTGCGRRLPYLTHPFYPSERNQCLGQDRIQGYSSSPIPTGKYLPVRREVGKSPAQPSHPLGQRP